MKNVNELSVAELISLAKMIDAEKHPEKSALIEKVLSEKKSALLQSLNVKKEEVEDRVASRKVRLRAYTIDITLVMVLTLPFTLTVDVNELLQQLLNPSFTSSLKTVMYTVMAYILINGYFLYQYSQTVGKRLVSIRIENLNGTRASILKIIGLRYLPVALCNLLPGMTGMMIVGLIDPMFIMGKDKRCLHDYIAQTKVRYVEKEA